MEAASASAHHACMDANPDETPSFEEPALRSAWSGWVTRSVTAEAATAALAVEAAVSTVIAGGSSEAAVVAAFVAAGMRPPAVAVQALQSERWRLEELLGELQRTVPSGHLPTDDLPGQGAAPLRSQLRRRQAIAEQAIASASALLLDPPRTGAGGPLDPGGTDGAGAVRRAQGVRILGATGVFLLVTSTLLFEVFGVPGGAHLARFAAVAVLEVVLAAAATACRRSDRFRPVMEVYLAAAALVLPLAIAAGLAAVSTGHAIHPAVALALGGTACATVYAWLAVSLPSRSYGSLALAALGVGWLAGVDAVGDFGSAGWVAPAAAVLTGCYLGADAMAVHGRTAGIDDPRWARAAEALTWPAPLFAAAAGSVSVLWATAVAVHDRGGRATAPSTLALLALVLALASRQPRRRACLPLAALAGSAAVLWLGPLVSWGRFGTAVALDALAVAALAGAPLASDGSRSRWTSRRPSDLAVSMWTLATCEALAVLVLPEGPSWWAPGVLLVAASVPAWVAHRSGGAGWAWASAPLAAASWFMAVWSVASTAGLVSVRSPGPLAVAAMMAPLPLLLAAVGLALRRRHPDVRIVAYGSAAGLAAQVLLLTLGAGDRTGAGTELLGIWVLATVVAWVEGWTALGAVGAGASAGLGGAALVALGLGLGRDAAAMAVLVVVLAEFLLGIVPPPTAGPIGVPPGQGHRTSALLSAGAVVLWTLAGLTWGDGRRVVAAMVAIAVWWTLVRVEYRRPDGAWWLGWASIAVASLAGVPIAALSGTRDPQWFVVAPAVALIVIGLRLPSDRRDAHGVSHGRWISATGSTVLLGTTVVQALPPAHRSTGSIVLLVAEGALSVLTGVVLQRRVPVVAGAGAVALGGLAALSLVPSTLALSLLIGAVAVAVLGASTVLLTGHRHLVRCESGPRPSVWSRWK